MNMNGLNSFCSFMIPYPKDFILESITGKKRSCLFPEILLIMTNEYLSLLKLSDLGLPCFTKQQISLSFIFTAVMHLLKFESYKLPYSSL